MSNFINFVGEIKDVTKKKPLDVLFAIFAKTILACLGSSE
jgi:hypothetical protein